MQTASVIWPYLGTESQRLWVVAAKDSPDANPRAVIAPYESVVQEDYVEEPEQHEGLLILFTSAAGAQRHLKYLLAHGEYREDQLVLRRVPTETLHKVLSQINQAYRIVRHRCLRVDLYDLKADGNYERELLYSNWIPKH